MFYVHDIPPRALPMANFFAWTVHSNKSRVFRCLRFFRPLWRNKQAVLILTNREQHWTWFLLQNVCIYSIYNLKREKSCKKIYSKNKTTTKTLQWATFDIEACQDGDKKHRWHMMRVQVSQPTIKGTNVETAIIHLNFKLNFKFYVSMMLFKVLKNYTKGLKKKE